MFRLKDRGEKDAPVDRVPAPIDRTPIGVIDRQLRISWGRTLGYREAKDKRSEEIELRVQDRLLDARLVEMAR